jgi:hypothetical protein
MVEAGVDARHVWLVRWTLPSSVRAGLSTRPSSKPWGRDAVRARSVEELEVELARKRALRAPDEPR